MASGFFDYKAMKDNIVPDASKLLKGHMGPEGSLGWTRTDPKGGPKIEFQYFNSDLPYLFRCPLAATKIKGTTKANKKSYIGTDGDPVSYIICSKCPAACIRLFEAKTAAHQASFEIHLGSTHDNKYPDSFRVCLDPTCGYAIKNMTRSEGLAACQHEETKETKTPRRSNGKRKKKEPRAVVTEETIEKGYAGPKRPRPESDDGLPDIAEPPLKKRRTSDNKLGQVDAKSGYYSVNGVDDVTTGEASDKLLDAAVDELAMIEAEAEANVAPEDIGVGPDEAAFFNSLKGFLSEGEESDGHYDWCVKEIGSYAVVNTGDPVDLVSLGEKPEMKD
jgi:hypothetical protein